MTPDRPTLLKAAALAAVAAGCSAPRSSSPRPQGPATGAATSPAATGSATSAGRTAAGAAAGATPASTPLPTIATEIGHGPRSGSQVALTFHGAGPASLATALLSEAERAGARLTIMAVGTWLDAEPAMARRVLDGGHELGNHTMHHLPMSRMDLGRALTEISAAAAVLHRLTGSSGTWFRPSGTAHAPRPVAVAAARAGYRHCLSYDVDSLDYTDPGPAAVVRAVRAGVRPGSIVSLHLGHSGTVTALPEILSVLAERHLSPVTVSTLLKTVS